MLLEYANLNLDAARPYNITYGDIYYNNDGGAAETEHVFIQGNRLPERFAACNGHFTIAEVGFGTGLNFICTADTFLRIAPANAMLHYLSFELHPLAPAAFAALQRGRVQPDIGAALVRHYPGNHPGHHLLKPHPRIRLHLILGDIRQTLPQLSARADVWYLDGFSPEKNPACWSESLLTEIARHCHPNAGLATFSAARSVRDGLTLAGFQTERIPGYGRKRHMTRAVLKNPPPPAEHCQEPFSLA